MRELENVRRWEPLDAPVKNAAGARAPEQLRAVTAQFNVEANPRYTPGGPGITWCNIFVWDATRALQAEIPHWVPDATAAGGRRELNVNGTLEWLELVGRSAGWRDVVELTARERAAFGHPTVALWRNPKGGHGHIALLLPPRAGEIHIAQAGRQCLFDVPLRKGFGAVQPILFFTHD